MSDPSRSSENDTAKGSIREDITNIPSAGGPENTVLSSMKKLLVQCTELGNVGGVNSNIETMSSEDRSFLEGALESTTKGRKENILMSIMGSLNGLCVEGRNPSEEDLTILEKLEEITEDINKGDEFINNEGLKLCENLIDTKKSEIIISISNVIANISSNNSTFQNHPDGTTLLKKLLLSSSSPVSPSVKSKLLYASSCIISSNPPAIRFLLNDKDLGLSYLYDLYNHNPNLQIRKRLGRIIGVIFRDVINPHILDPKKTVEFCNQLIEKWWDEDNIFVFVNLQLLHSIYIGKSIGVKKKMKQELNNKIQEIFSKTRSLQISKDSELAVVRDEEDGIETLNAFESVFTNTNPSPSTQSQPILSIRM